MRISTFLPIYKSCFQRSCLNSAIFFSNPGLFYQFQVQIQFFSNIHFIKQLFLFAKVSRLSILEFILLASFLQATSINNELQKQKIDFFSVEHLHSWNSRSEFAEMTKNKQTFINRCFSLFLHGNILFGSCSIGYNQINKLLLRIKNHSSELFCTLMDENQTLPVHVVLCLPIFQLIYLDQSYALFSGALVSVVR